MLRKTQALNTTDLDHTAQGMSIPASQGGKTRIHASFQGAQSQAAQKLVVVVVEVVVIVAVVAVVVVVVSSSSS